MTVTEILKNRCRILSKRLKAKGCEVMFSGILPRLRNDVEIMNRAIDVNQWLEELCREEVSEKSEMAGLLNSYFASTFTQEQSGELPIAESIYREGEEGLLQ